MWDKVRGAKARRGRARRKLSSTAIFLCILLQLLSSLVMRRVEMEEEGVLIERKVGNKGLDGVVQNCFNLHSSFPIIEGKTSQPIHYEISFNNSEEWAGCCPRREETDNFFFHWLTLLCGCVFFILFLFFFFFTLIIVK